MVQQTMDTNLANDPSVLFGEFLAHPSPGEEVVISGMSGVFPLSSNIDEYKFNLFNKVNMVSPIPQKNPELPRGLGKLKPGEIAKFDSGYFGIYKKEAGTMSQMCKLLLEKCVECIFDAGLHPEDLEGTKTGVYCAATLSENEPHWYFDEPVEKGNAICGIRLAFYAFVTVILALAFYYCWNTIFCFVPVFIVYLVLYYSYVSWY